MDLLVVAVLLLSSQLWLGVVVAINRLAWGRWMAPTVPDLRPWAIALWWLGGAALVMLVFLALGVIFDWPSQGRTADVIFATMIGSMMTAPIAAYHAFITRHLWRRSAPPAASPARASRARDSPRTPRG